MAKKKKISQKYQIWIDARKKHHLSHSHIQMARELGLNPKKFGKLANHKQEPWKLPLPQFIEKIYYKRFKKEQPDTIQSIEQAAKEYNRRKDEHKIKKQKMKEQQLKNHLQQEK